MKNTLFLFILILINVYFITSTRLPTHKLKQTTSNTYVLTNLLTNEDIQYTCQSGGEPIVIWSVNKDSEIDSQVEVKPIYINQNLKASDLYLTENIKKSITSKDFLWFQVQNPSNGNAFGMITSSVGVYINSIIFPNVSCPKSKKIVSGYSIVYTQKSDGSLKEISNPVPYKNNDSLYYNIPIDKQVTQIEFEHYAWDEDFPWRNYFFDETQSMNYRLSPIDVNSRLLLGSGFYICGQV